MAGCYIACKNVIVNICVDKLFFGLAQSQRFRKSPFPDIFELVVEDFVLVEAEEFWCPALPVEELKVFLEGERIYIGRDVAASKDPAYVLGEEGCAGARYDELFHYFCIIECADPAFPAFFLLDLINKQVFGCRMELEDCFLDIIKWRFDEMGVVEVEKGDATRRNLLAEEILNELVEDGCFSASPYADNVLDMGELKDSYERRNILPGDPCKSGDTCRVSPPRIPRYTGFFEHTITKSYLFIYVSIIIEHYRQLLSILIVTENPLDDARTFGGVCVWVMVLLVLP